MNCKTLTEQLQALPNLEVYEDDPFETGGLIEFNNAPKVCKLYEYETEIGNRFIDKVLYPDLKLIRKFDAIVITN